MKKILLIIVSVVMFSSCASIFSGSKKSITFDSNIRPDNPVSVTIDGMLYSNVQFPFEAKVKRGFSSSKAMAKAEGYKNSIIIIDKEFNATTLWNILVGGLIGFGIDAATGAMTKPEFNFYTFQFEKE
ncbi:MAG: hypothetical protein LBO06_03065 [Bacteroidales bacterium]|jgi:hypothetical protein|nr:hypothetical protein [Bacteroidales bacterium]